MGGKPHGLGAGQLREDVRRLVAAPDPHPREDVGRRPGHAIRDDIPIMLIDEAETVDDAEHERLMAKADADGVKPTFEA